MYNSKIFLSQKYIQKGACFNEENKDMETSKDFTYNRMSFLKCNMKNMRV